MHRFLPALIFATAIARLAHAADPPASSGIPDRFHANTILPSPMPDDPQFTPTLVTLDLHNATGIQAARALTEATGISIDTPRFESRSAPTFNLTLDKAPLIDAMLQIQASGRVNFLNTVENGLSVRPVIRNDLPGLWSVTGPFAFVLTTIDHEVSLGTDGKPQPEFPGSAAEHFSMNLTALAEPRIRVLQYPGKLEIKEFVDEKGNSLQPITDLPPRARMQKEFSPYPEIFIPIHYPDKPGRLIKAFSATGNFLIAADTKSIALDNPFTADVADKDLGTMMAHIEKPEWNAQQKRIEWKITLTRENTTDDAWQQLLPGLHDLRLKVTGDPKMIFTSARADAQGTGDRITLAFACRVLERGNLRADIPNAPSVTSFALDIPTAIKKITVPIEFHDLPLP